MPLSCASARDNTAVNAVESFTKLCFVDCWLLKYYKNVLDVGMLFVKKSSACFDSVTICNCVGR
jgi:hypothetical protein